MLVHDTIEKKRVEKEKQSLGCGSEETDTLKYLE